MDPAEQGARVLLERQLLVSLERRRDLERVRLDAQAAAQKATAALPPPSGLLERDDLRRDAQQVDAALEADARRLELLHADRDAAALRLLQAIAVARRTEEGKETHTAIADAKLGVEYAESATAELDALIAVVEAQQNATRARRDAIGRRLAASRADLRPTSAEIAEVERRLDERGTQLQQRLQTSIDGRDAAQRERDDARDSANAEHMTTLSERLNTRDVDVQLVREGLSNLTVERTAWQIALRYWRDGDATALAEARERGPSARAAIARRLEFMNASTQLVLAKIDALNARLAQTAEGDETTEWREQRATYEERLRLGQDALLDQHRLLALIDRLRDDFDTRVGTASFAERFAFGWAALRHSIANAWNFELFTVAQTIEVDGRQTAVPRSVTVAKLIEAPLLLVLGMLIIFRVTKMLERYARHRGVDEVHARLTRRWTLGILVCACALTSLLLAGIPLAAFAFLGGAVAIGLGFGMQNMIKNLISGVLLLIERPFRVGDEIQIGDLRGTVVGIDLRASVVRDNEGGETMVPNSALIEQNVRNATSRQKAVRNALSIVVDTHSDPREVTETMRAAVHRHGLLVSSREPQVLLEEFGVDGLQFKLHYWTEPMTNTERQRVASDLRLMILTAFHAAGIQLVEQVFQGNRMMFSEK